MSVQLYTTLLFVAARKRASASRTVEEVREFVPIPEISSGYLAKSKAEGHAEARPSAAFIRNGGGLASAEILDVDVSAETDVVGEVPAVVVWVVVDDDLVGAPVPVTAEAVVSWGDIEIETAEPEALA